MFVDIRSDDLSELVGDPEKDGHRQISVYCDVLYKKMKGKDKLIHATPTGDSSTLIIRFHLPR